VGSDVPSKSKSGKTDGNSGGKRFARPDCRLDFQGRSSPNVNLMTWGSLHFFPDRVSRSLKADRSVINRVVSPGVIFKSVHRASESSIAIHLALILLTAAAGSVARGQVGEEGAQWPDWSVISVAHRGGIVEGYPENTLVAYRRAIEVGADVIEIDLRGTKDGEVVILHDPTLDRTTSGSGPVTDQTLAELKALDAGGGETIPTYEEVLGLVSGTGVKLLLDIKVSPMLDKRKVVRLTEQYGLVLDVIVGARTLEDLNEFRQLNPNLRTLGFVKTIEDIDSFAQAGVDIIRLWDRWIESEPELVGMVHRLGRPAWVTAKDASPAKIEQLIRTGVNGVLSDYPEQMALLLEEVDKAKPEQ
jgi:glycerophosphoryl diester phosphodiesterase